MSVAATLRSEFEQGGPIRFDRFMEVALYGDGGFFSTDAGRAGLLGDFVTSVELGPVFGAVLARRLLAWSTRLPHVAPGDSEVAEMAPGRSDTEADVSSRLGGRLLRVADLGGGRGTLAAQLGVAGGGRIEAVAVDRAVQPGGVGTLATLPWVPDVVVAHELLDNLPARLLYGSDAELRVGFETGGEACLFHVPLDMELTSYRDRWLQAGGAGVVPVPIGAVTCLAEVAALRPALVVVIDYGADVMDLARRDDWPVRGYVAQREVDPIAAPGATDITCDVPFDVIEAELQRHGYRTARLRQRDWLEGHGLAEVVAAAGAADPPTGLGRLRAAEARTQATELCDPAGLGDFWVLEATMP